MQDFHQKPVPTDIQAQVTALGSAMGTVPSGKTLQGQVDTLNSNIGNIVGSIDSNLYVHALGGNKSLSLGNAKAGMIIVFNRAANNIKDVYCIDAALSVNHIVGSTSYFTLTLSNNTLTIQSSIDSTITIVVIRPYSLS